ncbi:hypothetical protein V494_06027, partial [Pseudogymnoascus sp. VKM F-4513 (FW-928)]
GYTQYFANLTAIAEAEEAAAAASAAGAGGGAVVSNDGELDVEGGKGGKGGKKPKDGKGGKGGKGGDSPKHGGGGGGEFKYEIEYSTFNDSRGFALPDLTVRSFLGLAHRIGRARGGISSFGAESWDLEVDDDEEVDEEEEGGERGVVEKAWDWLSTTTADTTDEGVDAEGEGGGVDAQGKKKKKKKHGKKGGKKKKKRERTWRVFVNRAFVGTGAEEGMGGSSVEREEL